jgi:UDP-glucose 4-epimerase
MARGQVFNVGADTPYCVNDLAHIVSEAMGVDCRIRHLDARNEVKIAFSDHSKAERIFGKRDKTTLENGVRAMAEWVKGHGARESSVFSDIEVSKKLPPSWASLVTSRP